MTTPFGQAGTAKYVQLTTFRKDGTPVSSPLWAALDGDKLLMWTVTDSWKVKRLRRNPDVVVQACDVRGKQTYGEPVSGTAAILDAAGTDHAREVVQKKYGLLGWATVKGSLLRRGKKGTVGLAITASN
ncbi:MULTISPECIES: PPOX class F420-dependent oxidoreductase [Actinomycetes]|uniref:PPOX class F420-dependent oxidoreductase n=1 Tax=Actinomycetes TaxID=1760 RepID=UPI0004C18AD0|nr:MULTISPECIES: PPOX class F420-dependent oxidoreductase [Actinomycetes]